VIGDACVFALPQVSNEFACEHGKLVTRRAGPDIACNSPAMQQQCACVYERLKQIGLTEFEFEDDLTQVPHGVWAKIQFGGLLGLDALCNDSDKRTLDNIAGTIQLVMQQYSELGMLPVEQITASMNAYRNRRRKK